MCNRDDKVHEVLSGLVKRNILSVPVLIHSNKYYGFLDLMDIVRYVVEHFGATSFTKERSFLELLKEEQTFTNKTGLDQHTTKERDEGDGGVEDVSHALTNVLCVISSLSSF